MPPVALLRQAAAALRASGDPMAAELADQLLADAEPGGWGKRERDAAVLDALTYCPAAWPTVAAKQLELRLDSYLAGPWRGDRRSDVPPPGAERAALFRLAFANNGKSLRWRRIHDIASQ